VFDIQFACVLFGKEEKKEEETQEPKPQIRQEDPKERRTQKKMTGRPYLVIFV